MELIEQPLITEKSASPLGEGELHVFKVKKAADKIQIRRAIELMFKVEVASVNVVNVMGKIKRFGKSFGKRQDWKKAYIRLKPGHTIQFGSP
ncbi:MAG: 50S ribosomal protein L23 [Methylococcaceae bacterium]